ncbi:hypothetical protein ACFQXA_28000 [Nocardiopsis composta]
MLGPADVPDGAVPVEEEPYFPDDAGAATQNMAAVGSDDATQAVPRVSDEFGGRPMFRDEAPPARPAPPPRSTCPGSTTSTTSRRAAAAVPGPRC